MRLSLSRQRFTLIEFLVAIAGNEKSADPFNRILLQIWHNNRSNNCHIGNETYRYHPGGGNGSRDGSLPFPEHRSGDVSRAHHPGRR